MKDSDISFLSQVSKAVSLLPSADFYLIEKSSISSQNTALFPIMIHMRTVEAMLFALLESKNTPPQANIPPRWGSVDPIFNICCFFCGHWRSLVVSEDLTKPLILFVCRVLNMTRTAVGRHFGLMVGEARTSGAQIVQQLMTESVTQKLPRVNFPPELLVKYGNSFRMGRRRGGEELCDALLQAVTFYELLSESAS